MNSASKIMLRNVLYALSILLFFGASEQAFAECTYISGHGPINYGWSPGNVVVQRDTPVGAIIYSKVLSGGEAFLSCTGEANTNYYKMTYLGGIATSIAHAYATNIPGVAIKADFAWGYLDNPPSTDNTGTGSVPQPPISIKLYKTGDITPGPFTIGQVGTWTVSDITPLTLNISGGYVTQVACSVTTPNLTFPIGDVLKSEFGSTVGYIPAKTSTQNLGLDCDRFANINVTLNGKQNPDVSDASVLVLDNQGGADVAQGVGVQLLYNGTPLEINSMLALKESNGGQETFPLTARYYQTRTAVTVGEANASATLTLTYQ